MKVIDVYEEFHLNENRRLKLNYDQLRQCGLNTGFLSTIKNGKDFHQINKQIAISFMHFHDGQLTNTLFHDDQPIKLDFDDEIIAYYSDYIELRYIIKGKLVVDFSGKKAIFNEGDVCFINSMSYHKESIEESHCLLLNISVQRDFITEAFIDSVSLTPLKKFLRKNILRYSDEQDYLLFTPDNTQENLKIQEYLSIICKEAVKQNVGYLEICKGYINRMMCDLSIGYRFDFNKQETEQYSQKLFDDISDYIKSNLQNISMEMLTKEFHYQPNYFNLLIKKYTGMTYSDYLTYLRLEMSKQYLKVTDLAIEEIMWMIGYSNKGFFYKKFLDYTGTTPSKYRKLK